MNSKTMQDALCKKEQIVIIPKGNSMFPLIRGGKDVVEVRRLEQEPKKNDIVLYTDSNGNYILHRLVGKDDRGYILCGDGQTAKEYGIQQNQMLGYVTEFYRGEKKIRVCEWKYKLYTMCWQGLLPVRNRLVLWLHHREKRKNR